MNNTISLTSLKFLWEIIKPYRWWYALILQAPFFAAFYIFANNYTLKLLVDAFSVESNIQYNKLVFPISLFISAQIFQDIVYRTSDFAERKCQPFIRQKILHHAYDYIQHYSYSFFQNTPSGAIISQIKGIADGYDNIYANLVQVSGRHFCVIFVSIFVLSLINYQVFLFMSIWGVAFALVMIPMTAKLNKLSMDTTEHKHKVLGFFSDNITNIFSLFYFSKHKAELKRANKLMENTYIPSQIKLAKYAFKFNVVGAVFYWTMLICIFLFMIYLRKNAMISTGDFVFVMLTAITISFYFWGFMKGICNLMRDIGDFKSSFSILTKHHTEIDSLESKDFIIKNGDIEFRNLSFYYEKSSYVFNELSLSIRAGQKVVFIGHTGAGKSTLISLLLKNFNIQSGDILIDNEPIRYIKANSLRKQVALIPQDIMLFNRTIGENIGYAKDNASLDEIKHAAKLVNIHKTIESLPDKYNTLVGERGIKLSGGQRQQIAIARAILKNAPIIIFDEATSNLDSITEQNIQESINSILNKNKSTVIAIAHRLSTIKHMDRIIVMKKGSIIEDGTFEQLIKVENGYFKKLWNCQTNGMIL